MPSTPRVELEAERGLLGAFLIEPARIDQYIEDLPPALFYKDGSRIVWEAMRRLHRAGQGVDAITVAAELRREGLFDVAGGHTYLAILQEEGTVATQIPAYIDLLREAATKRALLDLGERLLRGASNGQPAEALLAEVRAFEPLGPHASTPGVGWPLYDAADDWAFPTIVQLIETLLPTAGVVWWGGLPKRFKSLLLLYLCLAIACRRPLVAQKFRILGTPRILYVSREDGGTRLQDRIADVLTAWGQRPEPEAIRFLIRPAFDLLDDGQIRWLRETCQAERIGLLVLDTWTALSPTADPLATKDQALLARVVTTLAEAIQGLVVVVDHSRKNRPEGQALSSADIHGSYVKWASADHVVMLDLTADRKRLEVFVEGKDVDVARFFLEVAPKGAATEKFTYAGSVESVADAARVKGDQNRDAVLAALRAAAQAVSVSNLVDLLAAEGVTLKSDTVLKHLGALQKGGLAVRTGSGPRTRYVAAPPISDEAVIRDSV